MALNLYYQVFLIHFDVIALEVRIDLKTLAEEQSHPLLLVSPKDKKGALEAVKGGADIIDVKNPVEGSLGANFPWVIQEIRDIAPSGKIVSAAIGDIPDLPGTCSLAALGAAYAGADILKVGLKGPKTVEDATYLMDRVVRAVRTFDVHKVVVAAGYADAERINGIDPLTVPRIAKESHADFAMLDTAIKDGKQLFDFLPLSKLKEFVNTAHEFDLGAALAGSITRSDLELLAHVNVDVLGIRGAVCESDRRNGRITASAVKKFKEALKNVARTKHT